MKYQILFSGKSKKYIINLSSAELTKRVVKVKQPLEYYGQKEKITRNVFL